jgi:hypothetical protein
VKIRAKNATCVFAENKKGNSAHVSFVFTNLCSITFTMCSVHRVLKLLITEYFSIDDIMPLSPPSQPPGPVHQVTVLKIYKAT